MKEVSKFLEQALGRPAVIQAARAWITLRRWEEVAGSLAEESTVTDYDNGIVFVKTETAPCGLEIRMRRDAILAELNRLAEEPGLFTDLKVTTKRSRRPSL